jgi:hypothetical protein
MQANVGAWHDLRVTLRPRPCGTEWPIAGSGWLRTKEREPCNSLHALGAHRRGVRHARHRASRGLCNRGTGSHFRAFPCPGNLVLVSRVGWCWVYLIPSGPLKLFAVPLERRGCRRFAIKYEILILGTFSMPASELYRRKAEACLRAAGEIHDTTERVELFGIALGYLSLARYVAARHEDSAVYRTDTPEHHPGPA